jgi:hypothetical protein
LETDRSDEDLAGVERLAMNSDLKNKAKELIEADDEIGLDVLLRDQDNRSDLKSHAYFNPYVYAIKADHCHLIGYLHCRGFDLQRANTTSNKRQKRNTDDEDDRAEQPMRPYPNSLVEAIKCENASAVRILVELKVNVNSFDYKQIPLQIAYNLYQKRRHEVRSPTSVKVGPTKKKSITRPMLVKTLKP